MKASKSNLTSTYLDSTSPSWSALSFQVGLRINISSFIGEINLKGVNLKPDKANKLIQAAGVPFTLKAGTIGMLKVKVNYFSMFQSSLTAPMEITITDLFLILGPNLSQRSNEDSFYGLDDLIAPYDEENMYNIFTN